MNIMKCDIKLGLQTHHYSSITLREDDRLFNSLLLGPTGSGSTLLLLDMIHQDIKNMKQMIDIGKNKTNKVTLIDSTGGLSQRILSMAIKEGIPNDRIVYIDPTINGGFNFNPLIGDYREVLNAFLNMLEDHFLALDFSAAEQQKEIVQNLLFLLKHTEDEANFADLISCFENARKLYEYYLKLNDKLSKGKLQFKELKNNELQIYFKSWMETYVNVITTERGVICEFKESESWDQLRSVFKELATKSNLFSGNRPFDLNSYLEEGGIMLVVPTAHALGQKAYMLGKYILSRIEQSLYNLNANHEFHHLIIDQAFSFIYDDFPKLLAQTRRLRVSVTLVEQCLSRWAEKYGEAMLHTSVANIRNIFVFGGINVQDARLMAKLLGDHSLTERPLSSKDLMVQDAFVCAAKVMKNSSPMPTVQIKAHYNAG
jgi:hypothetical protein